MAVTRRQRVLAWVLAPTALLAVCGLVIHLPPVEERVARALVGMLASRLGGGLSVDRLEYRLWRGSVTVEGLRYENRAGANGLDVEVATPEAEARWSPWSGLALSVLRPRIELARRAPSPGKEPGGVSVDRRGRDSRAGAAAAAPVDAGLPAVLTHLSIESARLIWTDASRDLRARLGPFDLELEPDPGDAAGLEGLEGRLVVNEGRLELRGDVVRLLGASASLESRDGELFVENGRLDLDAGHVDVEAEVATLDPLSGQASMSLEWDAAELGDLLGQPSLRGRIEAEASLGATAPAGSVTGAGTVAVSDLEWQRTGPWRGELGFRLEDDVLALPSIAFRGSGGSIVADARLDLDRGGTQTIHARWKELSLSSLVRSLGGAPLEGANLESSVSGQTELSLSGFRLDTVTGHGTVHLADDVAGTIALSVDAGAFRARTSSLALPGGALGFEAQLDPSHRLDADFHLDLEDIGQTASSLLPERWVEVEGALDVDGEVSGDTTAPRSMRAGLRIRSKALRLNGRELALDGRLRYGEGVFRLTDLVARADGETRLKAAGTITLSSSEAHTSEVTLGLRSFPLAALPSRWGPFEGAVTGDVALRGDVLRRPDVEAELAIDDVAYRGLEGSGDVEAVTPGAPLRIDHSSLQLSGSLTRRTGRARLRLERVRFRGTTLPDVIVRASSAEGGDEAEASIALEPGGEVLSARTELVGAFPTTLHVSLGRLPWSDLADAAGWDTLSQVAVAGRLESRLPLAHPGDLEVEAKVTSLSARVAGTQVAVSRPFTAHGSAASIELERLSVTGEGTDVELDGELALTHDGRSSLHARGEIDLEPWESLLPGDGVAGDARFDLTFEGSLARPRLDGVLGLENGGWSEGPIAVEDARGEVRANGDAVAIEALDARVLGGRFTARGELPLPGADGEELTGASLRFRAREVNLAPVLPGLGAGGSASGVSLPISVEGEASIREASLDGIAASGVVSSVELQTPVSTASMDSTASWSFSRGRFVLAPVRLTGDGTDLTIEAEGRWPDWSGFVRGKANLLLATAFTHDSVLVSGELGVDLTAAGGRGGLELEGTGRLQGGELVLDEPPLVVSRIDARARVAAGAIVLEHLEAEASGGTLTARGRLPWGGGTESGSGHLQMKAHGVRMEYPEGLRSELDAELELSGGEGRDRAYDLAGSVVIDRARYGRRLSVERELLRSIRSQTVALAREPGFGSRLRLDVDVATDNDIVVDNNLGRIRAAADVTVTGTADSPEITGTVRARPGGELRFAGTTYEIERARMTVASYPLSPPEVEVRARTESGGYDLVLALSGPLDHLTTELSSPSDPSLSRADVASLLLTGRKLEDVRGDEGEVVAEQAARYLGGGLADFAGRELGEALPLTSTSLSVAPADVGSETNPEARLSLGQAISDDLFLTYSIGLDDTESQLWIVDYDLPAGFELRAVRDDANAYTGTLSQRTALDLHERDRPLEPGAQPGPEIQSIRLRGDLPLPERELRRKLSLSQGDRFDYWRAREDAEAVRRELARAGYLGARVFVDETPVEDSTEVALTYRVEASDPIVITWSGDVPGRKLRDQVREQWDDYLPPRAVATEAATRLERELASEGYYAATVTPRLSRREGVTEVELAVTLGAKGSRVVLSFEGNAAIEEGELEALLPEPSSPAFFEMVRDRRDDLRDSVRLLYATNGYLDARVVDLRTRFDVPAAAFRVDVEIEEGAPSHVSRVVIEGAEAISPERLTENLSLGAGSLLRLGEFLRDRRALASFYRSEGFPDASVRSRMERSSDGFEIVYRIEEHERVTVGEIRIAGNVATDDDVVRRAFQFQPGDALRRRDLLASQGRLYDLQAFRSVNVHPEPTGVAGVSDVAVDLVELPDMNLRYGIRYSTETAWEVTGNVELVNLFGEARRLSLNAFVNRNDQAYRGTFHLPYFFGLDLGTELFVEREIEIDDTLETRAWAVTFQQARGARESFRAQWSYTFRRARVGSLDASDGPFGFDVAANRGILTGSLIHDSRDSLTSPRRGWFWNTTSQFGAAALGSDLRFLRVFGQVFHFEPVIDAGGRGIVWASSYRAGLAHPFGDQVLLPQDRFQAGGPSSVRGFALDGLSPVDPEVGARIGGAGVFVMNQELRVPVWRRFGAVVFYDAGNVYLNASDFNPFDLRHSLGVGLRVGLPVGLVRLDWARVLNPGAGDETTRWHFSFGHAF